MLENVVGELESPSSSTRSLQLSSTLSLFCLLELLDRYLGSPLLPPGSHSSAGRPIRDESHLSHRSCWRSPTRGQPRD